MARVIEREPDWDALPVSTPPPIRRLLRRCLQKDRKRRLDSAAAARFDVEEAMAPVGENGDGVAHPRARVAPGTAVGPDRRISGCARARAPFWGPT